MLLECPTHKLGENITTTSSCRVLILKSIWSPLVVENTKLRSRKAETLTLAAGRVIASAFQVSVVAWRRNHQQQRMRSWQHPGLSLYICWQLHVKQPVDVIRSVPWESWELSAALQDIMGWFFELGSFLQYQWFMWDTGVHSIFLLCPFTHLI